MSLNALGLGFVFSAKDLAGSVIDGVRSKYGKLEAKLSDVRAAVEKAGPQLEGMARKAALIGGIGLAGFGFAAREASVFGKGIAEVSTLVDEAKFSADQLSSSVIDMGLAYGGDLAVQTKALYQSISAGAGDAASAQSLLTSANKLAIGGVTDTSTAVDGLTNVLNSYSLSFDHANEVSDAFFVALKSGKTTAAELGATVGRLAPTAVSVGISFDEMLASISAVTTKGLKTEEAVSGLKAALSNVINPTAETAKEAARLGIKFDAATLRAKGFKGFLDSITGSAKFNKDSMAKLFGSIEGLNAVLALTAGEGKTFAGILDTMGNKAGETDRAFDKMAATSAFQAQRFTALRQTALVLIGEAIRPLTLGLQKFANMVLEAFVKAPKPVREFITKLALVAAGFLSVAGSFIAFKVSWLMFAPKIMPVITAIGTVLGSLAIPIVVLTLLAAGLYVAWERNLGGFRDLVGNVFKNVSLVFRSLYELLTTGKLSGPLLKEFQASGKGIQDFVITAFLWVKRIQNFFSKLIDTFTDVIGEIEPQIKVFIDALKEVGKAFGVTQDGADQARGKFASFGEAGKVVGYVIGAAFGVIVAAATLAAGVLTGVISGIKTLFLGFLDIVSGVWDIIAGIFTGDWGRVWDGAKKVVFGVVDSIVGVLLSLVGVAAKVIDTIGGMFGKNLGLQSTIEEFKATLSKEQRVSFGLAAGAPAAPAVAQAAAQNEQANRFVTQVALKPGAATGAPTMVQTNTHIVLDGEVLATHVAQHQASSDNRGFKPVQKADA